MNHLIIFSKNRAAQLDLLLKSIKVNTENLFQDISVIYTTDNDMYQRGYDLLIEENNEIYFIKETDGFRNTLINTFDNFYPYTTFMVDDMIVYRKVNYSINDVSNIFKCDDTFCFSMRLGFNCNYSHPANLTYHVLNPKHFGNFNYVIPMNETVDFSYPLSTDGHIFRTNDIYDLIKAIPFNNPNQLESNLQSKLYLVYNSKMFFDKTSSTVSLPINLVNNTHRNRNGLEFYFTEQDMNYQFLEGKRFKLENINFENINGPHKEIKIKLE